MSTFSRDKNRFPNQCQRCGLSMTPKEVWVDEYGSEVCVNCYEHDNKLKAKRNEEARHMAYEATREEEAEIISRDGIVRQFLGNMPYSVLASALGEHELIIDDPYAKAAYLHATGDAIPETDVYGVCACAEDGKVGWHSYVRSDGTISGWHAAVSKVKAEYDTHLAQRLVPAIQDHSRREMLTRRKDLAAQRQQEAAYATSHEFHYEAKIMAGESMTFSPTNSVRITQV